MRAGGGVAPREVMAGGSVRDHRLDKDLDAGDRDLTQFDRQRSALLGRDSAGASIRDVAVRIQRAEVAARFCHRLHALRR